MQLCVAKEGRWFSFSVPRSKESLVSQQAIPSPRGSYRKIADQIRLRVDNNPTMTELPSAVDITTEYGVSRGVALRVLKALCEDGVAEPVPGKRWRIIRNGISPSRSLHEQLAGVIARDGLQVGDPFPSSTDLMARFGVSRPTLTKALDQLHARGLVSGARQGKSRIVLSRPGEAPTARTVGDLRRALEGVPNDVALDVAVVVHRQGGGNVVLRPADQDSKPGFPH